MNHSERTAACACGARATIYCLQCDIENCTECLETTHHEGLPRLHGFMRVEVWHDLRVKAHQAYLHQKESECQVTASHGSHTAFSAERSAVKRGRTKSDSSTASHDFMSTDAYTRVPRSGLLGLVGALRSKLQRR